MKHLFVALGQHHVNNFENLIKNNLIESGETVLLAGADLAIDRSNWDEIYLSRKSFNNNSISLKTQFTSINGKIKEYKKLITQVKHLQNEAITVYVSYIEDVLSNYLFLSFSSVAKAVIVEDGTLNYYNHSLVNINSNKFKVKQLFAALHGISFKRYQGHSSGAEYSHVVAQYLSLPEHAFIRKNAKQLPIVKESIEQFQNTLFIIGQESYGTLLGQHQFETALHAFLKTLKKQAFYKEINTIYYKPHRNGKQLDRDYLEKVFVEKKVEIIQTDSTSEEIYFSEIKSMNIAAFDSSTLINIFSKLHQKDRDRIQFYVNPLKNNELLPLFKKLNFNFLNTKSQ